MIKLDNGWHVPDGDIKMTSHVSLDVSVDNPTYEQRHRDTILKYIPNTNTFVDVGANLGIWSISMSSIFKNIIAFEPSPRNRECLEENLKNRGEIRPFAVSNVEGVAYFSDAVKNCGDSKLVNPEASTKRKQYQVDLVKLDNQNITDCSLIKIDVQGHELQVVQGAEQLITEQQPWVIFEINEDIDEICNFFESKNYEMIINKSKRVFIFAPKEGKNKPIDDSAFGRWFGPGPYKKLLKVR